MIAKRTSCDYADSLTQGGRLPPFDKEPYKDRNVVERCFNRLKQFRAAAQALTKYDPQQKAQKNNFSARPNPKDDNGAGGRLMADFYRLNRIIGGTDDGFLIKVS